MPLIRAVLLGVVQGLTEFLPVSSSAHLELVPWLAGWEHFGGSAVREQAFDVALHVGTLAGAVLFLRADIAKYSRAVLRALRGVGSRDAAVAVLLVLTAVPAALVALALEEPLLRAGEQQLLIAASLGVFGWVLVWAHRQGAEGRLVDQLSPADAATLGAAQAFALVPGVSRSGAAMTAGRLLGFEAGEAARIAFLMSLPVIAGAAAYRSLDVLRGAVPAEDLGPMLVGGATAAVASFASLWALARLLRPVAAGRTFAWAATYRTLAAAAVVLVLATNLH